MHCFKLMSKMAIMAVMFLVITAVSAFSTPINTYMDLGHSSLGVTTTIQDTDTLTSIFDQISYYANLNTTQYDTVNDGLLSVGDFYITQGNVEATGILPVAGYDTEGMNSTYELTFVLSDLVGVVDDISITTNHDYVSNTYLSGKIDMYIDPARDHTHNGTVDLTDDEGFGVSDTSILVATIDNIRGTGTSKFVSRSVNGTDPVFENGSYDISGTFTYLLDDFWYTENGEDLLEKLVDFAWLVGAADGNVDRIEQEFNPDIHKEITHDDYGNVLYTLDTDSNASFELTAVPEPATCLLLGCGLLSLSGISRKKFKK